MTVDISNLMVATPVATSDTNPVALELNGAEALAQFPSVIQELSDGSIQFSAPTKGASSKSTRRTRCEWSELSSWTLDSAEDHWNRQEMTLTKVNSAQKVVISQMHVRGDNGPPVKVFWNKGNITMGFRQTYDQVNPVNSTVLKGVPLGSPFKVSIHVTSTGQVNIEAECAGATGGSGNLQLDRSWNDHLFEFHGGVYNQIDYTESTPIEDGSICVITQLSLIHA